MPRAQGGAGRRSWRTPGADRNTGGARIKRRLTAGSASASWRMAEKDFSGYYVNNARKSYKM
ncbi:hypothetical protein HZB06_02290 [Candidatus Wolfebacteria bacterium]|nr:hypothetical protein [Candidatus Wolfebacteria bacterium]